MKYLELAAQVCQLFAQPLPPSEAFRRALAAVCETIGATGSALALWDQEADALQIVASLEDGSRHLASVNAELRCSRAKSVLVDVYVRRQPVFVADCFPGGQLDPRLAGSAASLDALGASALAILPLLVLGECVGALAIAFPAPRPFSPDDEHLFELVSGWLACQAKLALASHQLTTERAFFQRVLEHAPTAIALFDRSLNFRLVNRAWTTLTGVKADDAVGHDYHSVFPDAPRPASKVIAAFDLGSIIKAEASPWDGLGGDTGRRFDLTYCPVLDSTGNVAGVLMVANEVTERMQVIDLQRKQLEALSSAEEAKDQFLSVLSHELRTPINSVTGFGSLLLEGVPVEPLPEQMQFLRKLLQGAEQLVGIVDDLLDASRIAADRLKLYPVHFEFRDEVDRTVERLRPAAEDKGLDLRVDIPEDLPPIMADDRRVTQILANLLSNAVKFTPAGGAVVLRARSDGGHLLCEVQDTGQGVSPEQLPYLFERFTQADMTTTREFGGLGLGLALVKALVEAHDGQVGADSLLGAGSTFWFTLPVGGPTGKSGWNGAQTRSTVLSD